MTTYKAFIDDAEMDQIPHWLSEGIWKLRHADQPAHILPPIAHLTNGPSGLTFNSGTSLPDRYRNHFLICDYKGAPNLCFLYSFKVRQAGAGYEMYDDHLFHGGVPNTDVEVGYDGKIYLADFGGGWVRSDTGNIYTLFDSEGIQRPEVEQTKTLFAHGFDKLDTIDLLRLLSHADMRVRQRAQFAIVKQGPSSVNALEAIAMNGDDKFARFHAIWGLGQLRAGSQLIGLLGDADAEIQAQAVRTLGNIQHQPAKQIIRKLIAHPSPRVRTFAAIASGKLRDVDAVDVLTSLLRTNGDRDAYERHAAVFGLSLVAEQERIASLASDESPSVRLGALLALRRMKSDRVADFLLDDNAFIVAEAIRSINDDRIESARPALADYSREFASANGNLDIPNEDLFRRLINANLRVGTPERAVTVLEFAENDQLPMTYRLLALKTLELFDSPPRIDATLGIYVPLPPRDGSEIRTSIESELERLFERSTGDLAAASVRVMSHYGIKLDPRSIVTRMRDGRQPTEVRLAALNQLIEEKDFSQKLLMRSLLEDEDPVVLNGACRAYVTAFPDETIPTVKGMLEKYDDMDFRTAYDILAERDGEEEARVLAEEVDKMLNGSLFRTVHLDLYLAVKKCRQPLLAKKAAEIESWHAGETQPIHTMTLAGGDVERGRAVFQNQGVCLKCHKAERGGGDVGPELTYIARLRQPHELLESVLEPNAKVVSGFGTITLVLDDGLVVEGTLIEETSDHVTIKTPLGETQVISVEAIEDRSEIRSPMPKPTENLSLQEIRDLMAYLQQLETRQ